MGDVTRVRMWTRRTLAAGYDVSAYLHRGVLIDTGFRHVRRELEAVLDELSPSGVIVTHWHEDHAGNAPTLAGRYPVWMGEGTRDRLRERPRVKLYRHVVWGRPRRLSHPVEPARDAPLRLVHTPGHSFDHHVAHDPDTDTVFGGDLWLGVRVRVIGREENPYRILESLDRVIALRPARLFDAHRGLVDDPVESLRARRDWLQETIGDIERRVAAGDPDGVILRAVLDGEELSALVTEGEYSRRNLVRAVRALSGASGGSSRSPRSSPVPPSGGTRPPGASSSPRDGRTGA